MGCCFSKPATADDGQSRYNPNIGSNQSVLFDYLWVRILRLENAPNADLNPLSHGDFYCRVELLMQNAGGSVVKCDSYRSEEGKGQFKEVSGKNPKWDQMVKLQGPKISSWEGWQLRVTVMDKDTFTDDDVVGVCILDCTVLRNAVDREKTLAVSVQLRPNMKTDDGRDCKLKLRVYGPRMGDAVLQLDAYKESRVAMMGDYGVLSEFMVLWENFFSGLFPYEGNRPCMSWVARVGGPKKVAELMNFQAPFDVLFPSHMTPTKSPVKALQLMIAYCDGAADQGVEVMKIDGRGLTIQDLKKRISDVLPCVVQASEIAKQWSQTPAKQRLGMVGGMGPVAGAGFALELDKMMKSQDATKTIADLGWELCMYSDPSVETAKTESLEAWKTVRSAITILNYLHLDAFKYTCIASNTAHLMLQPSPPSNCLSIFEAVAMEIKRKFPGQKVALLCTTPSMRFVEWGYAEIFKKHDLEFIHPGESGMQEKCMHGIELVKNPTEGPSSHKKALDCFMQCFQWYSDQGASVMALACTEIGIVVKPEMVASDKRLQGRNIHFVDSVTALGDTVVQNLKGSSSIYPVTN